MDNWFVKTATLVAAFGAGAGSQLMLEGANAKAAVSRPETRTISVELSSGQESALAGFINSNHCPALNELLQLTGDDECDAASHFEDGHIRRGGTPKVTTMDVTFAIPGSWVPGAPQ